jgi:uncharacterized protein
VTPIRSLIGHRSVAGFTHVRREASAKAHVDHRILIGIHSLWRASTVSYSPTQGNLVPTPSLTDFQFCTESLGLSTLAGTKSWNFQSQIVEQEFVIDIAAPFAPGPAGQRYPVVYVLDGDGTFGIAAQTARLLQLARALPPLVLVGVGYRLNPHADAIGRMFGLRTRDFAPTIDHNYVAQGRAAPAPFTHPHDIQPGQADKFLEFMNEELKPFISSQYATDEEDQSLVGISLGGLFVLHALFTSPTSFRRYLAGSPSIWWDQCVLFQEEEALAKRIKELPARLFLSAGALEEQDAPAYLPVSNVHRLAAQLLGRNFPGLQVMCHIFPDETHASVVPATISRGLRLLFSKSA